ncbi:MAG: 16S rRNA (cytosine(1402)-N(4))-methyltransferase RsmH [Candidatus Nanopelagicales bacterium]|jgi:16S rRNA (cytosine1402-N4)-methyltransferase|nr:16S rRNA (cytosine(1402)-N(4))-methyltransferase RsmH [Candidatus Nanopelagicales bacterium]MDP4985872.1 16S rRNA (cytosine(1402)-N(4))-methyltransferase RsmH [Candidatus Nanopelagicales bacterium]
MTEKSLPQQHIPVMCDRVIELLSPALNVSNPVLLDATLGLGGHSEALLKKFINLKIIGIDRDQTALDRAQKRLGELANRVQFVNETYDQITKILEDKKVNAVLLDLGVSSIQLDEANRGFSYAQDAPLDMRMNSKDSLTAAQILNNYEAKELTYILRTYGEEKFAKRIAQEIVKQRNIKPFITTFELVKLIKDVIPAPARRTGGNPAKRTFQALRIAVNNELQILEKAIPQAMAALVVGGRILVLSYHSLEDRIVKNAFKSQSSIIDALPGLPVLLSKNIAPFELVTRKAEQASNEEISANPRATSVRLRVAQKVAVAA